MHVVVSALEHIPWFYASSKELNASCNVNIYPYALEQFAGDENRAAQSDVTSSFRADKPPTKKEK